MSNVGHPVAYEPIVLDSAADPEPARSEQSPAASLFEALVPGGAIGASALSKARARQGERNSVLAVEPVADRFAVTCAYTSEGVLVPSLRVTYTIARGQDNAPKTAYVFGADRKTAEADNKLDLVGLPGLGDEAYATYDQASATLEAHIRSANAIVDGTFQLSKEDVDSWNVTYPLQGQSMGVGMFMQQFLTYLR